MILKAPDVFIDAVRSRPLFAAEGADLHRWDSVLTRLESVARTCIDVEAAESKRILWFTRFFSLEKYLLPLRFLRALRICEQTRRDFLSDTSMESARNLVSSWHACQKALLSDAKRFARMHRILFFLYRVPRHAYIADFFCHAFSRDDIVRQNQVLIQNAYAVKKVIASFESVLSGYGSVEWPTKPKAALTVRRAKALTPLQSKLSILSRAAFGDHPIEISYSGPYLLSVPHFDQELTEHAFEFFVLKDENETHFARIMLADRYYFLDISDTDPKRYGANRPEIYQPLIDRGIRYWYQPGAYLYSTRDSTFWADIATIADKENRSALNASLLDEQRSSLFPLLMGAVVNSLDVFTIIKKSLARLQVRETGMAQLYRILMRSNPSILFLPFNGSVWVVPEKIDFLGAYKEKKPKVYLTEDEIDETLTEKGWEEVMNAPLMRRHVWEEEERSNLR